MDGDGLSIYRGSWRTYPGETGRDWGKSGQLEVFIPILCATSELASDQAVGTVVKATILVAQDAM